MHLLHSILGPHVEQWYVSWCRGLDLDSFLRKYHNKYKVSWLLQMEVLKPRTVVRIAIVKRKKLVHFYLIPCWVRCSPNHIRQFDRTHFTTTETHCIEHAGRTRVMFGRGGVCFYVFWACYCEDGTAANTHLPWLESESAWRGYWM